MAGVHRPDATAIPLGRPSPDASSNQPERQGQRTRPRGSENPRIAPIRFCSRRGLPCRRRCRPRGALLPHPFTLTVRRTLSARLQAVCFLWRYPWGRPRRTLSGAASVWSPDFPPLSKAAAVRPTGSKGDRRARAARSRDNPQAASGRWDRVEHRSASAVVHCSFTKNMGLSQPAGLTRFFKEPGRRRRN